MHETAENTAAMDWTLPYDARRPAVCGSMAVATSQPNAAGFHDLLGNVEEWTAADPKADEAMIAGGSVGWLAEPGFPAKSVPKREKSRILGFRILVE